MSAQTTQQRDYTAAAALSTPLAVRSFEHSIDHTGRQHHRGSSDRHRERMNRITALQARVRDAIRFRLNRELGHCSYSRSLGKLHPNITFMSGNKSLI